MTIGFNAIKERYIAVFLAILTLFSWTGSVLAVIEEDEAVLKMYYGKDALALAPTRYLRDVSQTAENMVVITAGDIEAMNAHTVAEVLNRVPGLRIIMINAYGNLAMPSIQGSENRHVRLMIDGIAVNTIGDNFPTVGDIPVQHIDHIEIVKGPASATWGSSLGGVINIVTKSGESVGHNGGMLSGSYGVRGSGDYRAEASGKVKNFSYYIYGGELRSDGFAHHDKFEMNSFYTKLIWNLSQVLKVRLTLGYNDKKSQGGEVLNTYLQDISSNRLDTTLSLIYTPDKDTDLSLSFRDTQGRLKSIIAYLPPIVTTPSIKKTDDDRMQSSLLYTKKKGSELFSIGCDYEDVAVESITKAMNGRSQEKISFFVNNTFLLPNFTITPGIRYEHVSTGEDILSPSLGATYELWKDMLLRFYTARGFNTPPLGLMYGAGSLYTASNPDLKSEKVWSYNIGLETKALKYVWLKASVFTHEVSDAIDREKLSETKYRFANINKQRRQGFEVEVETIPISNTVISTGVGLVNAKNLTTGDPVQEASGYTIDVAAKYDDKGTVKMLLNGHFIKWYDVVEDVKGTFNSFVFDFNASKLIYKSGTTKIELFLTGHNILNNSQYAYDIYKNPGRWVEGGMRFRY